MLKMNKNIFIFLISLISLLISCKSQEKSSELNYMQNVEELAMEAAVRSSEATIQKGDELAISITAKDMAVVRPFNQNYSTAEVSQYSTPKGNLPTSQNSERGSAPIYIVDSSGEIDFPILGKLSTEGKSLVIFQDEIRDGVARYVKQPSVSIRITNYKVTVLGEVNSPGQYTIPDGQATILNALGLAGDLTMYGKRNDVLVIRNSDGQITKQWINLLDANFINSPFFQLKQNDVIYVSSSQTKEKAARLDPNTSTYIAVAGMILGLVGVFVTIFK